MKLNEFYREYSGEIYQLVQTFAAMRFVKKNIPHEGFDIQPSVTFEVGSGESIGCFVASGTFNFLYRGKVYVIRVRAEECPDGTGGEMFPVMEYAVRGHMGGEEEMRKFEEVYDSIMIEALAFYEVTEDYYQRAVVKMDTGNDREVVA